MLHKPLHKRLHSSLVSNNISDSLDAAVSLGASFDGLNDYLTRGADLTGNADGKTGILATRIRFNGGDGVNQRFVFGDAAGVGYFQFIRNASNKIQLLGYNSSIVQILGVTSTTSVVVASGYVNLLLAWDLAAATVQLYLDDSSDSSAPLTTNQLINYTVSDWGIGARVNGNDKCNADANFLYLNLAETIDFSVEANRRKFFNASGGVVDMGDDGSIPTGTAPIVFQQGLFNQWHTNKGGGGGFTVNGELTAPK